MPGRSSAPDDASASSVHYRACNLCEAICGLEIRHDGGTITSIRGDRMDPFSRGHICPKAVALKDIHEDPDRLRQPLLRRRTGFEPVSWEAALDAAAAGLKRVRSRYGREALAVYAGNPNAHSWGSILYARPFYRAIRAGRRYTATSVDQLPHHVAAWLMFGHQMLLPVPDIDRTDYLLVIGGNPVVSNGSLMTAPDIKRRLKSIRQRGGRIVVLDPRRTETAAFADEHLFVRPGSDALLLAALVHTLLEEDLTAPGRLADFTDGIEALSGALAAFAPERVAARVGQEAGVIRNLARALAAAPTACVYGRMGVSVQRFGGLCQWLVNVINLLTGNLDRPGGAMFPGPAVDLVSLYGPGSLGRFGSLVRGLPEFSGELPVATMAEDMLADDPGATRALVTLAGNPVLSTPNGRHLDQALEQLEFMVSVDIYVNETTRHADVILPPTGPLERDHYDIVFHQLAIRNTARYSPALFAPAPEAKHDWEIFLDLAGRLDDAPPMERLKAGALRWYLRRQGPRGLLHRLLRTGPYAHTLSFDQLLSAPHGIDLGSLGPALPERLKTPARRIQAAPPRLLADLPRLAAELAPDEAIDTPGDGQLLLISRRQPRSNNSWMHNYPRLMKGPDRCTLQMHPDDAARRAITDGALAVVRSAAGRITVPVQVTDEIMPGVVCLPHGFGHDRPGVRLQVAGRHSGASVNDLTDHRRVDELTGNAALSGVPVSVAPAQAVSGGAALA